MAGLTDQEIERVRYHLGYPSVVKGAGIGLGMPTYVQVLFPVEGALRNLKPEAVDNVRTLIARCDSAEQGMVEAQERMSAARVGEIELRQDEFEARRRAYRYWVQRLSEATGAPINPMREGAAAFNVRRIGM